MLNMSLLALTLWGGVLVEPFRIAEAEPGHHQGCLRAAMASDGHFAVSWWDSLRVDYPPFCELELFVRFFDLDGNPLTDAYKITNVADTNLIGGPDLDMDSAGNTVLIWTEYPPRNPNEDLLRLQLFDPSGNPLGSHQTNHQGYMGESDRAVGLSLNNQGEFAIAWDCDTGGVICARRYSFQGGPQGDPFVVHDDLPDGVSSYYPGVALNDAGDLVVTWYEFHTNGDGYLKFQVFDAEDEPILPWEPMGHLVTDDSLGGTRVEPYWLDNDRFVFFWIDHVWPWHIAGRVFADRGLTRYPICRLVRDSLPGNWADNDGRFAVALSSDERFAETHLRYSKLHEESSGFWMRPGGVIGEIQDNQVWRRTNLFEHTAPFGIDTTFKTDFIPTVAACDDRIVWVYSRPTPDSLCEAWAMITDWDMGVGVVEQPIVEKPSNWEVITSIGSQIVLRYHDRPDGFRASIFDATGRKVDEIHSVSPSGTITWGKELTPGVYFIRPESESSSSTRITQKVVLVR